MIKIIIKQFANNPNANFCIQVFLDNLEILHQDCNDYLVDEDVQHPK